MSAALFTTIRNIDRWLLPRFPACRLVIQWASCPRVNSDRNSRRSTWILTGLVVGAVLGALFETWFSGPALDDAVANVIKPIGTVFLRLIFMVVVPLIVSAIVLGVVELGDVRRLGRVGVRCLGMTLLLSGASVIVGLVMVNLVQPGHRIDPTMREKLVAQYTTQAGEKIAQAAQKKPLHQTLLDLIPQNPLEEAVNAFNPEKANGGLIAVMVFSLIFGAAMTVLGAENVAPLKAVFDVVFRVSLKVIDFAMALAPVCVACLSFALTATTGLDLLGALAAYLAVVLGGMALHQFGVYSAALALLGGKSPRTFFRQAREAMVTAFSTSSSNATLPVSLRVAEQDLRLPPQISRFVLTVGASANQNGTALYEGVTVLFLAQVFGVHLTLGQQLVVALMCILAGVGTAGVPGGSLPLVVGVLMTIGVPAPAIAIILGIDRFLDMCRTVLNVTGDLVIATVVARGTPVPPAILEHE
jgi:DAACS family dicarboxylate/amino acid:cation (Na+ or H+) symporter